MKLYGDLTKENKPMAANDMPISFNQRERVEDTSKNGKPETKPRSNITSIRLSAYIFNDFSHFFKENLLEYSYMFGMLSVNR